MPHRKVVHPTAQYRIDQLHDPIHWLRLVAAEHILEFPLQRRSPLELGRVIGTPRPSTTANAAKVESQKAEASASTEVYDFTHMGIYGSRCSDQNYIVNFLSLLRIQGLSPFA